MTPPAGRSSRCHRKNLEALRLELCRLLANGRADGAATLWGWNFGFDYAPSGYRLHASHQQVHQQYAMIPATVGAYSGNPDDRLGELPAFGCGDLIAEVIEQYRAALCRRFLRRLPERPSPPTGAWTAATTSRAVFWSGATTTAMLFVPKAQTSQWELQLMTRVEADRRLRRQHPRGGHRSPGIPRYRHPHGPEGPGRPRREDGHLHRVPEEAWLQRAPRTSPCSMPFCRVCRNRPGPSARPSSASSTATIPRISPLVCRRQLG